MKKSSASSIHLKYEYKQDTKLRPNYVHGVWGGVNPHGEVEMNFYVEYDKIPLATQCELTPEGRITPEEDLNHEEGTKQIVREINSKLIMSYSTARAVMEWISDQLEMMESCEDGDFDISPPIDSPEQ